MTARVAVAREPDRGTTETTVPGRLDRLPWSRWHWLVLIGLGTVWILDGLEVTIVGAVGSTLTMKGSGITISTAQVGTAAGVYVAGACVGALLFGHLTDRYGRRRLFLVTLGLYLIATVLTATSQDAWMFFIFRFLTGMGIGGEYSAINSAIDELIPARVRGTVDLLVNGSYWVGTAVGAAATLVLLDPRVLAVDLGWRVCFFMGAVLGLGVLIVRRHLPESPRWLFTHGRSEEADRIVDDIERQVRESTGRELEDPGEAIKVRQRPPVSFVEVARVVFGSYPRRSVLGLSLFVGQAFLYNAVFFTYALVLTTFYHVSSSSVGYYLIAFAVGNLLGPLILGRLFDVVGRRPMIAGTYLSSGALLAITAWLFDRGDLTAFSQTVAWVVIFFLASAGASSAYLTVSEIFPMETRALAIAFFYAIGTGLGGIIGPVLFGQLVATKRPGDMAIGYLIGGCLMAAAGLVEVFLGVDAEQQSLEDIAAPLSATEETTAGEETTPAAPARTAARPAPSPVGPYPPPWRRFGQAAWSPRPQASLYPRDDPYLGREVDAIVDMVNSAGPMSPLQLSRAVRAQYWGPGRFRMAVRSAMAAGRIRRVGRNRLAAGSQTADVPAAGAHQRP
ncbi:MAG TPA: MFS transporter [Acidimicrobiales bacterium]|nr:MFS transporter [Acidimicrobiales bacterium]